MVVMIPADQALDLHYSFSAIAGEEGWDIVFPDLPGCTSWSADWEHIGTQAHEAFRMHVAGFREDGLLVPAPREYPLPVADAFVPVLDPDVSLITAAQLAQIFGVTPRRINAIARRRGLIGRRIGQTMAWSTAAIPLFKPGQRGRPSRIDNRQVKSEPMAAD